MNIATLTIEMAANVARLRQDMDNAASVVQGATAKMQKAAELAGKALGLIGVGLSLTAFTGFIRHAIDAADALDEMSGRVGVSAKELSGLQLAYKQAGMGNEAMASSLAKLSREMSEGNAGLRALGVNTRNADGSLRGTTAVLLDVADKFTTLEDGAAKTALAVEIFGKSGTEMVPLLNSGSEGIAQMTAMAEKLGLVIEDSTAAQAGNFNDTLELLGLGVQGVGTRIAAQLLPTLNSLTGSFLESMTSGDRLAGVADFLAASLKILYTVGLGIVEVFNTVGKTLGAAMGQVLAILRGDFAQASEIGSAWQQDVKAGWSSTSAAVQAAWSAEGNAAVASAAATMKISKDLLAEQKLRDEAAKKSAAASAKAAEEAKKLAADGAKFAASLLAQDSGLSGDFAEKWAKLSAAYAAGAISMDTLTLAQRKLLQDQPAMKKALDDAQKAAQAAADARNKESDGIEAWLAAQRQAAAETVSSVNARVRSLQEEDRAAMLSREKNISLAQAIELVAIARLKEEQAAKFNEGSEGWQAIEREIEARERLAATIGQQDIRQREEAGWSAMWSSVDSTAHDVFTNVFEGGSNVFKKLGQTLKASVLDLLYQMVVRKWIINIGTSIMGGGFGAAANAATGSGGGGIGGLFNMASTANSAYGLYSGGFGGTAIGQAYAGYTGATLPAGMVGPSMTPVSMWSGLGNTTGGIGSGAAGGGAGAGSSSLAAGGAFVAVAALVLNALGAFKSDRQTGSGFQGTLGGTVSPYEEWREGGSLFSGSSSSKFNPLQNLIDQRAELQGLRDQGLGASGGAITLQANIDAIEKKYGDLITSAAAQNKIIQDSYDGMRQSAGDMADALGLSSESVRKFTIDLSGDREIELQGLTPEEQQAKFAEALATANNELAQQVLGSWVTTTEDITRVMAEGRDSDSEVLRIWEETNSVTTTRYVASEYAKEGEKAIETLTRLATSLGTVNDIFRNLGATLYESSLAGADGASKLVDAFGGIENLQSGFSAYYESYYSDAEKIANTTRTLSDAFADLGVQMPKTKPELRALVDEYIAQGAAGADTVAALIGLAPAFAGITDSASSMQSAFSISAEGLKTILDEAIANAGSAAEASRLASSAFEEQMYGSLQDGLTSDLAGLLSGAINPLLDSLIGGAAASSAALAAGGAAAASSMATGGAIGASASAQGGAAAAGAMASGGSAAAGAMVSGGSTVGGVVASVLDQARAYVSAYSQILADPAIKDMIGQISGMVGDVAGIAYTGISAGGGGGGWQSAGSPSAPLSSAADDYNKALQSVGATVEAEVKRLRKIMVEGSPLSREILMAQFAAATGQARAGDKAALEKLPELSKAIESVSADTAVSSVELARTRGWLAGSMEETLKTLGLLSGASKSTPALVAPQPVQKAVPSVFSPVPVAAYASASNDALLTAVNGLRQDLATWHANDDSDTEEAQALRLRAVRSSERLEQLVATNKGVTL